MLEQEYYNNSRETINQLLNRIRQLEKEKELLIQYVQKSTKLANGMVDWKFSTDTIEELFKNT